MTQYKLNNLETHATAPRSSIISKRESFLDICMADNRHHFHGLTTQKELKSFDCGHETVSIKISLKTYEDFKIDNSKIKYNYNKAE